MLRISSVALESGGCVVEVRGKKFTCQQFHAAQPQCPNMLRLRQLEPLSVCVFQQGCSLSKSSWKFFIAFLSMFHVQGAFQRILPGGIWAKVCVFHFCLVEETLLSLEERSRMYRKLRRLEEFLALRWMKQVIHPNERKFSSQG